MRERKILWERKVFEKKKKCHDKEKKKKKMLWEREKFYEKEKMTLLRKNVTRKRKMSLINTVGVIFC